MSDLELIAVAGSAIAAGLSTYGAVVVPAVIEEEPEAEYDAFPTIHKRMTLLAQPLGLISSAAALWRSQRGIATDSNLWLAAGGLGVAIIPVSIFLVEPMSHRILDRPSGGKAAGAADRRKDLRNWHKRHLVRWGINLVSLGLMLHGVSDRRKRAVLV